MALTLASNVSAATQNIPVSGTVPDNVGSGYRFALDDEILLLRRFGTVTRANSPAVITENRQVWVCSRAQDGSLATTHSAGASVFAVADAWTASTGLTPPDPIIAGGGGGAPAAHAASHEDGGSDEIDVTGLVGAGGSIASVDFTLDDATIKALVASPYEILPVRAGYARIVTGAYLLASLTAPYTVPANTFLLISTPAAILGSTFDGFRETPAASFMDQTGMVASTTFNNAIGGVQANPFLTQVATSDPTVMNLSKVANQPVILTNDRPGEYTDGNAANRLFGRVWYVDVPVTIA